VPDTASEQWLNAFVHRFSHLLEEQGLHAALGLLNARTRHRFTGVYRFDPPMLRSLSLFDRENPGVRLGCDAPMRETYCSLVSRRGAPFATGDAGRDSRLVDHPARATVVAYCGVPLRSDDGACFGSLCHFDSRPRLAPTSEIVVLERVSALVMRVAAAASEVS
jgi:GAF domain-containing protein